MQPKTDAGDTAWLLISTALVLLMTPALALFYGGMVRTEKCTFDADALARRASAFDACKWALFGYSITFGPSQHGRDWRSARWRRLGPLIEPSARVGSVARVLRVPNDVRRASRRR